VSKHTPGPWHLHIGDDYAEVSVQCGDATIEIFNAYRDEECVDADARLIAAAPDMLAALRALDDVNLDVGGVFAREIVDAAIAKAEGEGSK